MSKFNLEEATQEFLEEHIPTHECGDECDKGEGFFLLMHMGEDQVIHTSTGTHHMDPTTVIQAFIQWLDGAFIRNKPEAMPAVMAFEQGREMLRQAIEGLAPPADVSMGLDRFLQEMAERMAADDE